MAGDKETKMNPPPEFSGSAEKARDFLRQVDLYITCKKDQFKDDTARIGVDFVFHMRRTWRSLAGEYMTHSLTALDPLSTTTPQTWAQFRPTSLTVLSKERNPRSRATSSNAFFREEARLQGLRHWV